MKNPFDDLETVKIQLISTWIDPFMVTGIIIVFTLMLLPQLENLDEELTLLSCAAPILALMCILILDFLPPSNRIIHSISKHTGLVFVFFLLYMHLWDNTTWNHFNGSFFIFCQSIGLIVASGFIDKMYKKKNSSRKYIKLFQIILTSIFLILPNSYNVQLKKTAWETILRIFLFTLTAWFQLFAAIVFEDDVDEFEFFNGIWWILIIQRYMIPIVGFVWMNSLLRISKHFSNKQIIVRKSEESSKPLLETVIEEEAFIEKSSPPRKPTNMFAVPIKTDSEPRQRMLRRGWKTRGCLQPKLSQQEQLKKLQEMSAGVSTVSDSV